MKCKHCGTPCDYNPGWDEDNTVSPYIHISDDRNADHDAEPEEYPFTPEQKVIDVDAQLDAEAATTPKPEKKKRRQRAPRAA